MAFSGEFGVEKVLSLFVTQSYAGHSPVRQLNELCVSNLIY